MSVLGRTFLLIATVAIFHGNINAVVGVIYIPDVPVIAAFSTYEHLSHLKALERPEGQLPQDIVIEAFVRIGARNFGGIPQRPTFERDNMGKRNGQAVGILIPSHLSIYNFAQVNR
ncbi:hypothetical protein IW261DRAFT_1557668 [Armillaria novae-zelandiae]|uniref:Uncharacterized protein n=1 Tax=Armillaria novae-zelandiae TaxID=153914 RepID=A0AA39PRI2_9AGAR|nr:hypothetical protein IW261DRAFT_1557668 [Armillaria novae-zelandiae]